MKIVTLVAVGALALAAPVFAQMQPGPITVDVDR